MPRRDCNAARGVPSSGSSDGHRGMAARSRARTIYARVPRQRHRPGGFAPPDGGGSARAWRRIDRPSPARARRDRGARRGRSIIIGVLSGPGWRQRSRAPQLTVMSCDLVGSTALSARLDPEDLRAVIGAYHRCVAKAIGRGGGFVAKYMGDGVLAYFGYPRADEHDAERAVRAALKLVEKVAGLETVAAAPLQVRVGIATGLVVVGDLIGQGMSQEQAVVGETPNLAARLQALAEPGAVVIAPSTRRLTGGLFDYEDLGAVEIKGLAAPVVARDFVI